MSGWGEISDPESKASQSSITGPVVQPNVTNDNLLANWVGAAVEVPTRMIPNCLTVVDHPSHSTSGQTVEGQFDDDAIGDEHTHIEEVVREGWPSEQSDSLFLTNHPHNNAIRKTVQGQFDDVSLGDESSHIDDVAREAGRQSDSHACDNHIGQTAQGQFDDDSLGDESSHIDEMLGARDSDLASTASRLNRATSDNAAPYQALIESSHDDYESHQNFFLAEPVSHAELKATCDLVYENMNRVLRELEEGGVAVYKRYLEQRKSQSHALQEEPSAVAEQAIEEAIVRGAPRDYQTALLEIAKTQNSIIHLGTGKGKTLIALMCIKHFASSPEFVNHQKQTLFLVPSVVLALQQSMTLRANLPYSVGTACWNETQKSRVQLRQANVLVATHGAIHDLLMHYGDLFSFRDFNLVVLDECHYARGNHQYKIIMDKWYHTLPQDQRPRILGLTASPLVNVKHTHTDDQLRQMLTSLEQTLDAHLVTWSDDDESMANERQVAFVGAAEPSPPLDFPSHERCGIHPRRTRELNQLRVLYKDLGPLPVYLYVKDCAKEVSCNEYEKETSQQFQCLLIHLEAILDYCQQQMRLSQGRSDKLVKLENLLTEQLARRDWSVGLVFVQRRITAKALHAYFHRNEYMDVEKEVTRSVQDHFLLSSAKDSTRKSVKTVANQFEDSETDPGMAFIQFASKRPRIDDSVQFDYATMNELQSFHRPNPNDTNPSDTALNTIRCGVLVRQGSQAFRRCGNDSAIGCDPQEEALKQERSIRETLCALRNQEINVLLATSLVEEGVDVQACSFVVAFDAASSVKAYVQMKGRARQKNAHFFLFSEGGNLDLATPALQKLQIAEQRIHNFIMQRQDKSVLNTAIPMAYTVPEFGPTLSAELQAVEQGEYRARHGSVDLKSAKSLVNRYVLNIPIESTARATKESFLLHMPRYGENQLVLPAHLPLEVRVVTVPQRYQDLTKAIKHQIMALMACVRLHQLKLLNERLLPLGKHDLTQEFLRVVRNQTVKTTQYTASIRTLFDNGKSEVFLYPIIQRGEQLEKFNDVLNRDRRNLVLISCQRIPVKVDPTIYHHQELGEVHCELGQEILANFDESHWELCTKFFAVIFGARWRKKSRGHWFQSKTRNQFHELFAPHTVGLLTSKGCLDWNAMERVVNESCREPSDRRRACLLYDNLSPPRLCNPVYQRYTTYVVLGPTSLDCSSPFPDKLGGTIETFQDYYKLVHNCEVPSNDKLFVAQRLWFQPSQGKDYPPDHGLFIPSPDPKKSQRGEFSDLIMSCPGIPTVLLPQSVCIEADLADPSLSLLSILLPQLLYGLERRLVCHSFVEYCLINFPCLGEHIQKLSWNDLAVAMTAKSAGLDFDYDQHEWLGDGVLKLLQSDALLSSPELRVWVNYLHEGDLTTLRSSMGNNIFLAEVCRRIGFEKFIWTVALARGKWTPTHLECFSNKDDQILQRFASKPSIKVCADVIESLLGLIHIRFGYKTAISVGLEVGILLPQGKGVTMKNSFQSSVIPRAVVYETAKRLTGRAHFECPGLTEEALTHPSKVHEAVPSYQKLEWVGDAALCIGVREWVCRTFPTLPVGDMVTLEAALVSNEVLGYQCFKVGLHKLINHNDQSLPSKLEQYQWSLEEGRAIWGSDPPKPLADVFEALVGAAHVDGGYEAGQLAVRTLMGSIFETVESFGGDASKLSHPITKMNQLGGHLFDVDVQREEDFVRRHGPEARLWAKDSWKIGDICGSSFVGTVRVMGEQITSVEDSSWKGARNRACAFTVAALEKCPDLVQRWKEVTLAIDRDDTTILSE